MLINRFRIYYESVVDFGTIQQWISIASGIATVAVVYLLWRTVKQMEETAKVSKVQLTQRFRPWVGPSSGIEVMRTTPEGKHQFVIRIKNYAEVPAQNVVTFFMMKNETPTRDTLRSSDGIDKFNLGPLLPNMEKSYWFFIDADAIQKAKDGNVEIYVALYFSYEFEGGRSGYGMISQFQKDTNTFIHKDMWVD